MKKIIFGVFILWSLTYGEGEKEVFKELKEDVNYQKEIKQYGTDKLVVGQLSNISVTEIIKTTPDIAEFSVTYLTSGSTAAESSDKNAKNMEKLKEYLKTLGIQKSDLETLNYRNYSSSESEIVQVGPKKEEYEVVQNVEVYMPVNLFYQVLDILEMYGIDTLDTMNSNSGSDLSRLYVFKMIEKNNNKDEARRQMEMKFNTIKSKLEELGIKTPEITYYSNDKKDFTKTEKKIKKTYFVENTLKLKVRNFENLGKIISKSEELNMRISSEINYSLSDEKQDQVMKEKEKEIFEKLLSKVDRILNVSKYSSGDPVILSFNENGINFRPNNLNYSINSNYVNNFSVKSYDQNESNGTSEVVIQTPSEYEITLTLSGNFDILKKTDE